MLEYYLLLHIFIIEDLKYHTLVKKSEVISKMTDDLIYAIIETEQEMGERERERERELYYI